MKLTLRPQDAVFESVLSKLINHLNLSKVIVVGGVAIVHQLESRGVRRERRLGGIDFIHQDDTAISSGLLQDKFVVAHYHPNNRNEFGSTDPGAYWNLYDEPTGIEINLFPTTQWPAKGQIDPVEFEGQTLRVVGTEFQLVGLVHGLQRVDRGELLQPKHLEDCEILMPIADKVLAQKIWVKVGYREKFGGKTIRQAIRHAQSVVKRKPELLDEFPFRHSRDWTCPKCPDPSDPTWPTLSFSEVYDKFLKAKWGC